MFTLFVGNTHKSHLVKDRGCRTQPQFEAVQSIIGDVDFACNNPFQKDHADEEYDCTFAFLFYRQGCDQLRLAKITPTGRIKYLDAAKQEYVNELI